MSWRLGVDAGGTFTDVCTYDEQTGNITVIKIPSTPTDPGDAVLAGVPHPAVARRPDSVRAAAPWIFVHGTTVATNALLEARSCSHRPDYHRGLPRPAGDPSAEAAVALRPVARQAGTHGPAHLRLEVRERVASTGR